MKAVNIEWDVDFEEDLENLPTEIEIPSEIAADDYDAIDDYISNVTDYCFKGYYLVYSEEEMKI